MRFKGKIRGLDLDQECGKLEVSGERIGFMWEGGPTCTIAKILMEAMKTQLDVQMDFDEDWFVMIADLFRPGVFNNDDLL